MIVVGIDACQGKWLAIALQGDEYLGAQLSSTAAALLALWPDVEAVAIDIPIGLPDTPWRDADRAAREFVGERRSSVFATFPEVVLTASTYEEAKDLCTERGWPRPSLQSFGMRHRILEVSTLATIDERLFEVHPEVSFTELAGQPLASKRTAVGAAERRRILREAGIDVPDLPYPMEDVLDGAVAAWSAARYARGEARALPEGRQDRLGVIWR